MGGCGAVSDTLNSEEFLLTYPTAGGSMHLTRKHRFATTLGVGMLLCIAAQASTPAVAAESADEPPVVILPEPSFEEFEVDGTAAGTSAPNWDVPAIDPSSESTACNPGGASSWGCLSTISDESFVVDRSSAARQSIAVDFEAQIPDWCIERGISITYGIERLTACRASVAELTFWRRINNNPPFVTGTATLLLVNMVFSSKDLRDWGSIEEVTTTFATGVGVGASLKLRPSCTGEICKLENKLNINQVIIPGATERAEAYWKWPSHIPDDIGFGNSVWTLSAKGLGGGQTDEAVFTAPSLRCDNRLSPSGCVFVQATPTIYYYIDHWRDFARHVEEAQFSGLPGASYSGVPLHRTQDRALVALNRATSCPPRAAGGPIRPRGMSCDEYPFASTYEGAASAPGGGRTFDWCQFPTLPVGVVGPSGYSACMIDELLNSSAGNVLNTNLYKQFRVIEGDAFFVEITYPT